MKQSTRLLLENRRLRKEIENLKLEIVSLKNSKKDNDHTGSPPPIWPSRAWRGIAGNGSYAVAMVEAREPIATDSATGIKHVTVYY